MVPLIVARFVLRDREGFRARWFFLMTTFLLLPSIGVIFVESES